MALFTDFAPALTFATERAVPITGDGVDDNLFTLNQLSQRLGGFGRPRLSFLWRVDVCQPHRVLRTCRLRRVAIDDLCCLFLRAMS